MKALSIQQPWAWLIVNRIKPIENRTWKTPYSGPVLIHAGKKVDRQGYDWVLETFKNHEFIKTMPTLEKMPTGGVIGASYIYTCTKISKEKIWKGHNYAPWYIGPYFLELYKPKTFEMEFIPCPGKLRFFDIPLKIETNRAYRENCLATMLRMPSGFIDLTVTSPPYDDLREYKGGVKAFDFEEIAGELYRVTKPGGVVVWVVGDQTKDGSESGTSFMQALYFKKIGFNLHDTMIFKKKNRIVTNHRRYEQEFEFMFVLSKGEPKTWNPIKLPCVEAGKKRKWKDTCVGSKNTKSSKAARYRSGRVTVTGSEKTKGNIWEYATGAHMTKDKIAFEHPAIFPEGLPRDHIFTWTDPGDVVYDPMAGSGTVPKIAKLAGREWIASEVVPEYCDIIDKRLKNTFKFPPKEVE
ncbi:MAG: ASCH domain-containing protein [Candidatus Aminicenantes bacterium]|nr:ASCH domain-containing protein [Candidatus Aminicenantes bacterium]